MRFISNLKIKSKFGPLFLGGLTLVFLLVALFLSSTYSSEVLATSHTNTQNPTLAAPTPQPKTEIDDTGNSGFVICGNTVDNPCNVTHLFRAFIIIINYLITLAGLVAILFIVIAGVQMTASRGEEWLRQAKQRMTGAVIGLVLVALAFVLINSLLAGSLDLGLKQGAIILTDPAEYIQNTN